MSYPARPRSSIGHPWCSSRDRISPGADRISLGADGAPLSITVASHARPGGWWRRRRPAGHPTGGTPRTASFRRAHRDVGSSLRLSFPGLGPPAPVVATVTSAPSSSAAPTAICSAVSTVITGPRVHPERPELDLLRVRHQTFEEPGTGTFDRVQVRSHPTAGQGLGRGECSPPPPRQGLGYPSRQDVVGLGGLIELVIVGTHAAIMLGCLTGFHSGNHLDAMKSDRSHWIGRK